MKEDISIPVIERILVPVDRTVLSMKAANYGIHLAELEKAKELIVMHIVEDIKQGSAIGLRVKYGDVKMVEGFRKAKTGSAEEMIKPIEEEAPQLHYLQLSHCLSSVQMQPERQKLSEEKARRLAELYRYIKG